MTAAEASRVIDTSRLLVSRSECSVCKEISTYLTEMASSVLLSNRFYLVSFSCRVYHPMLSSLCASLLEASWRGCTDIWCSKLLKLAKKQKSLGKTLGNWFIKYSEVSRRALGKSFVTLFYGYGQTNMFAHSYTKGDHDFPEVKILARFFSDACQLEENVTGTPTSNSDSSSFTETVYL